MDWLTRRGLASAQAALPDGVEPLVCLGQGMIAGETVIADLTSTEGARSGRTA